MQIGHWVWLMSHANHEPVRCSFTANQSHRAPHAGQRMELHANVKPTIAITMPASTRPSEKIRWAPERVRTPANIVRLPKTTDAPPAMAFHHWPVLLIAELSNTSVVSRGRGLLGRSTTSEQEEQVAPRWRRHDESDKSYGLYPQRPSVIAQPCPQKCGNPNACESPCK